MHRINRVEIEGQGWVCDVGFGGSGFRQPLTLKAHVEGEQLGEIYRFHEYDVHGYCQQK